MAAKLLSLYLLAVAGLGVVRAGTSASWRLIHPVRRFVDDIREIVPLILDQRQDNPKGLSNGPVFNVTDFPLNATHVAVKRAGTSAILR
jgi:hypothetical protein